MASSPIITSPNNAASAPMWHMARVGRAVVTSFWNSSLGASIELATPGSPGSTAPHPRISGLPRLVVGDGRLIPPYGLDIEEVSLEQLDAAQPEWTALAERAIEPNVFFTPGFALSAARHFPMRNRPRFIVVWDMRFAPRRMAGLFPIVSSGAFGDGFVRMWLHKQATLATPLIDRLGAEDTLAAFFDWLEARSGSSGILFGQVLAGGPFHDLLRAAAGRSGRAICVLEMRQRAALFAGASAEDVIARASSRERLSQLRRQWRRLEAMGHVKVQEDALPQDVRRASEEFLALEASGWKARRGALLSQASLATFFRSATRLMAREEQCRIVSLRLDGRPLAMMVVLECQGRGFLWKTAYDEGFRAQAPGVQLFYAQTRAQLARPDIEMTDSCAAPDHPLIGRLWCDRIDIGDIAVQLRPGSERDFAASCRSNQRRRGVRELAKRAAYRMLNRKIS